MVREVEPLTVIRKPLGFRALLGVATPKGQADPCGVEFILAYAPTFTNAVEDPSVKGGTHK